MVDAINAIQIISLAAVDAINPCAFAVMVIVLMTLLLKSPDNRKNVLYGGLLFTLAVFILYFLYGLIIVQVFSHAIPETGKASFYIFKGFGIFAIILGALNLKDFFFYEPGSFATEMPMSFRPKMNRAISKITSPKGAFVVGLFVTLFLLPCTMGPYVIASGKISTLDILKTIPWLLLYNFIFVIPMIAITLIIYFGLRTAEEVSGWREKNVKYLHLAEALILIILGILMVTGILA
jgi:cytochrome c biogenesis protein CcdA